MYVYLFGLNYFRGCDSTPVFMAGKEIPKMLHEAG